MNVVQCQWSSLWSKTNVLNYVTSDSDSDNIDKKYKFHCKRKVSIPKKNQNLFDQMESFKTMIFSQKMEGAGGSKADWDFSENSFILAS